jgi:hypothetical protein
MGGVDKLLDRLFPARVRERRVLRDDRVGELEAMVRLSKPDAWVNWSGQSVLAGQARATRFHLSGDATGPYASLLEKAYWVLDNLDDVKARASRELAERAASSSMDDFHLDRLGDWDHVDEILLLEFAPARPGLLSDDVELEWPGGVCSHLVRLNARAT